MIPARLGSERLPRKPLQLIAGRPLVEWVWRCASSLRTLDVVVVATDSEEVIALRMANALDEMQHWRSYHYVMVSSTREEDYARFLALLGSERMRVSRMPDRDMPPLIC